MKKQYKLSRIKNHKIKKKKNIFRFGARKKKVLWKYPVTNDA